MKWIVRFSNFIKFYWDNLSISSKRRNQNPPQPNPHQQWLTSPDQSRAGSWPTTASPQKVRPKEPKYTPKEVYQYLRGPISSERAERVAQEASGFYAHYDSKVPTRFNGRERLFESLPFILYKYSQGMKAEEIAGSISYFTGVEDVEEALTYISEFIARRINATL